MSWCCLALRSSAEQEGNRASTEMAEVSRLRSGAAIRWGVALPGDRRTYLQPSLEGRMAEALVSGHQRGGLLPFE
jgi:hypothetical protein